MTTLAALAPILVILGLMLCLRWSAGQAGVAGLIVALPVAVLVFQLGGGAEGVGLAAALAGVAAEALFIAATILWIIGPALAIYELQQEGGAFAVVEKALGAVSREPRILAILVGWFFALFLEGAAGFGTPVALAAPVLVALGIPPVRALAIVLIAHSVGVSFGAVGTPLLPQMAATGLPPLALSLPTGLLHGALGWMMLLFAVRLAGTGGLLWPGVAAVSFLAPFTLIAAFVGPELPTLGGALLGGTVFVAAYRFAHRAGRQPSGTSPGELLGAALPYLVLLALILVTRLVAPIKDALEGLEIGWTLPGGFHGAMAPLYHPGTLLVAGFVVGGLLQGHGGGTLAGAAGRAVRRLPPVILALVAMLAVARLMVHAGMIEALADGAAATLGAVWPVVAPFVGVLGTFVTGSATASNVLLTDFQVATAERLALPVALLVAAQGFGAAVGNVVCPHNIVAGAATVNLARREGEVLALVLVPCLLYALAGGLLVLLAIPLLAPA